MKSKWVICIILASISFFMTQTNLEAANTSRVDAVLKKKVLDEQDLKIIDDFVRDAIAALVAERDLTKIATRRQTLLSRKGIQGQYISQFIDSSKTHLLKAFEDAKNLRPMNRQKTVITNLLILINDLENVEFAIFAANNLQDENVMVRYWAVQCLANPVLVAQLNSGQAQNPNLSKEITGKFKNLSANSNPEILSLIARFAATINIPEGQDLLLAVADERIKSYANWTVKQEFVDVNILKMLESKISNPAENANVSALSQRFAQLYSYAIQRYARAKDTLDEIQIKQLMTVIIEIEDKCIKNLLGQQQGLRDAISLDNIQRLMDEHNKLLGGEGIDGQLPQKLGFNYGSGRTAPLTLPEL